MRRFVQTYGRLLAVAAIVLVAAAVGLAVQANRNRHVDYSVRQACSVLTPRIVQSVTKQQLTQRQLKPLTNSDTTTTYCVYRGSDATAVLVVRSPKDAKGVQLNRNAFDKPPVSGQRIYGYGDSAIWTPTLGQFNVLQHNTWYIISYSTTDQPKGSLKLASQLAGRLTL